MGASAVADKLFEVSGFTGDDTTGEGAQVKVEVKDGVMTIKVLKTKAELDEEAAQKIVDEELAKVKDVYVVPFGTTDKVAAAKKLVEDDVDKTKVNVEVTEKDSKYTVTLTPEPAAEVKVEKEITVVVSVVKSANDFGIITTKNGGLYDGVSATFELGGEGLDKITSIKVEIFDANDNLLATNTFKSEKLPISAGNLTAPFVAIEKEGGYKTSSWVTKWTSGNPNPLIRPSKAVMTVTDDKGITYTAEEANLHTSHSGGITWFQLWVE